MDGEPLLRNLSDTARWTAAFRARETERSDALFRDPYASALAGDRGRALAAAMGEGDWAFVVRTHVFDGLIARCVAEGADAVVNLAAGMDARPYRMALPPSLLWVEVDLPELLDEKERTLADARPVCRLERVRLDLADADARRALFARIGAAARHVAVVSEGLLVYLAPDDVASLARDLAEAPTYRRWITDMVSPGMLGILRKAYAKRMADADAAFRFGPAEGPAWFEAHGWRPIDVPPSMLKTAARLRRVNFLLRLVAALPDSRGRQGSRPWGGAVLLGRGD